MLNRISKQTNCAYITLYTVQITHCAIKTSVQSTKATGEKRHKNTIIQHIRFYMNNFELKISFKLSFCLGFANLYSQTNKLLSVLTLHCTVYTLQYVPYIWELSKPETSQGWGPMWKIILWLRRRRVLIVSSINISKQTNYKM